MNKIMLANYQLYYTILYRKNRKTIQIKVKDTQLLEITAPVQYPATSIETLLQKKSKWILSRIDHLRKLSANPVNSALSQGTRILYLGKEYYLHFYYTTTDNTPTIRLEADKMQIVLPKFTHRNTDVIHQLIKKWYLAAAADLLTTKTMEWSKKLHVLPKQIHIKEQKTRWGSCSALGNINYNWRIIMAPTGVIDYLVVHELSHLRELNHSRQFWLLVESCLPNYKQERNWLKDNGYLLHRIL
ncbi:hypothetical protein P22_3028 [Propionispora sp. 2/2-37]|uniref:M48 family metallopeptidase n=1 Tax=Propionispora sp. 2/2-37 TaxID=1677858 RepID=UPI0006BB8C60|nr:SprT family zinc-dependent metalloprotease [Propionispora sp. 2/2-37]CUH96916.1 hypothetical protein P22_3028 [Propionispora sp. 2/2-37]